MVFEYNQTCEKLGLIPLNAPNSMGFDFEMNIQNNGKGQDIISRNPNEGIYVFFNLL